MSSNQRKGDVKLATLQKSLVKVVAGALNIFTEVQKEKFEIQTIAQMVADITAIVGKVSYDLSLKRRELIKSSLKPEFRSLCSANNEPTELLFGDDLTKHVEDLTMTNRLKRSEGYYQSKYSNKYSKDYAKSYPRQSFLGRGRGKAPKKVLEDQSSKPQEILIPTSEISLKHTPENFHGGQIAERIQEWKKLTSDKFILQMVRGDTIEFENDIPTKYNAKDPSFSLVEEEEIQVILEEMLHKRIIRETTHESTEFVSPTFIVKKPDGRTRLILNLKELNEFIRYEHFKMDGINTIINMVTRNCFMATIDLKDAYYSVGMSRLF